MQINRIEPSYWFNNLNENNLQLLIYGYDLNCANVQKLRSYVRFSGSRKILSTVFRNASEPPHRRLKARCIWRSDVPGGKSFSTCGALPDPYPPRG